MLGVWWGWVLVGGVCTSWCLVGCGRGMGFRFWCVLGILGGGVCVACVVLYQVVNSGGPLPWWRGLFCLVFVHRLFVVFFLAVEAHFDFALLSCGDFFFAFAAKDFGVHGFQPFGLFCVDITIVHNTRCCVKRFCKHFLLCSFCAKPAKTVTKFTHVDSCASMLCVGNYARLYILLSSFLTQGGSRPKTHPHAPSACGGQHAYGVGLRWLRGGVATHGATTRATSEAVMAAPHKRHNLTPVWCVFVCLAWGPLGGEAPKRKPPSETPQTNKQTHTRRHKTIQPKTINNSTKNNKKFRPQKNVNCFSFFTRFLRPLDP